MSKPLADMSLFRSFQQNVRNGYFGKKSLGVVSEHSTDKSFFRSVHRNVRNSKFFKILQE